MSPHVDILDDQERLARPFWGSVALHISAALVVLGYGSFGFGTKTMLIGDPHGGGFGSVAVTATSTIPLPHRTGPTNPVANDTESKVPAPPPKAKPQPKPKAPDLDAIPLKSKNATKRAADRAWSQPNKWREQQKDLPNQLYSTGGQSISSPMYNLPGGGGVGVGNNSPFGQQFGYYATLIRDQVARSWKTADIDARLQTAPAVVVTFVIRRDGSVAPGSVKISQTSNNRALDFSAQRAVYDAAPFAPLPTGFPGSTAPVELRFELRR